MPRALTIHKACPVVVRGGREVLAFVHPLAGKQIVKGTIEVGEEPADAALRELAEESGIAKCLSAKPIGESAVIADGQLWHFVLCETEPLPDRWNFFTADDGGHEFRFFWQPLESKLDAEWRPVFVHAIAQIQRLLTT